MARMDWEKRRAAEQGLESARAEAASKPIGARSRSRHTALLAFVEKHGLACFKCGATKAEWAKTGISDRGPWAICTTCVSNGLR
jgi:hypothetical protein